MIVRLQVLMKKISKLFRVLRNQVSRNGGNNSKVITNYWITIVLSLSIWKDIVKAKDIL